jgi:hypothetical protein
MKVVVQYVKCDSCELEIWNDQQKRADRRPPWEVLGHEFCDEHCARAFFHEAIGMRVELDKRIRLHEEADSRTIGAA